MVEFRDDIYSIVIGSTGLIYLDKRTEALAEESGEEVQE